MAQPLQLSADVKDFIHRIDAAVAKVDPHQICDEVKEALIDIASDGLTRLPSEFTADSSGGYARRLLHQCPDRTYSIMVMVWKPGQGTPIHDHAGKWCVECVMEGEIEIESYEPVGDPAADTCGFRHLDTVTAHVGEVGILVPPQEYHRIRNVGHDKAVTVHVYEGEMLWCHAFHEAGDGRYRRERQTLDYSD